MYPWHFNWAIRFCTVRIPTNTARPHKDFQFYQTPREFRRVFFSFYFWIQLNFNLSTVLLGVKLSYWRENKSPRTDTSLTNETANGSPGSVPLRYSDSRLNRISRFRTSLRVPHFRNPIDSGCGTVSNSRVELEMHSIVRNPGVSNEQFQNIQRSRE